MKNKILISARCSCKLAALAMARLANAGFDVSLDVDDFYKNLRQLERDARIEASKLNKQKCTGRKSDRKRNRANRWR